MCHVSDGASVHALVDALYAGLNALDAARLRQLYLPGAAIVRAVRPMSTPGLEGWLAGLPAVFTEHEELELGRRVELHGDLAQVTSRFLIQHRVTKAPLRSGTNLFTLVFDGARWWFAAAAWVVDEPAAR
jgi:ketosteroid isomerase-like protein